MLGIADKSRIRLTTEAEAWVRILRQKIKENIFFFISRYVYIEDRDSQETAIPFSLWPEQRKALNKMLSNRLIIILKARQLGLTWMTLVYSVWKMLTRTGYSIVALSKKEEPDAKELIRRVKFILNHLPMWMVREKSKAPENYSGLIWESTALKVTINHPGKEPSTFQSMSSAPDSGRSFTANLVLLDEWAFQEYAEEIWAGAYPLINRPTGGQVIGLSTGKRNTLFETEWNRAMTGTSGFVPIFLPWTTDIRRTREWYEQTKIDLPNSYRNEYPTNPADAFSVGAGAFFEEWDEDVHVIDHFEPTKEMSIYGAYDPGFASYACFKWYAITRDGKAVCFREYYPHRATDEEQAKQIIQMSCYDDGLPQTLSFVLYEDTERQQTVKVDVPGTPFFFDRIVADSDAWTKSRDYGISTAEIFDSFGLSMWQADKSLGPGWRRLHQWLRPYIDQHGDRTASLVFTRACKNTRRTYPSCVSSRSNPEDIDRNCEHHAQDTDRYFCASRPVPKIIKHKQEFGVGLKGVKVDFDGDRYLREAAEKAEKEALKELHSMHDENLGDTW